jgi:hypothetical protein
MVYDIALLTLVILSYIYQPLDLTKYSTFYMLGINSTIASDSQQTSPHLPPRHQASVVTLCESAGGGGGLAAEPWRRLVHGGWIHGRDLTIPGLVNIQKAIENGHRNSGFTH